MILTIIQKKKSVPIITAIFGAFIMVSKWSSQIFVIDKVIVHSQKPYNIVVFLYFR